MVGWYIAPCVLSVVFAFLLLLSTLLLLLLLSSKSMSYSVISPSKGGVAGGVCGECSGV